MTRDPVWQRVAAAGVHVYTACGSVLALLIVLAAIGGQPLRALWLGLAALVVDGTDGMLARRLRVKERLPWFDGARLDDIVDYLTYAFAPMVLLWTGHYLPSGTLGTVLAAIPLLASSYQFCRTDAKTDDHFFLGFPSYWNVVAFYAVVLPMSPAVLGVVLVLLSVLVFVPIRYLYPSRTRVLHGVNLVLTAVWLGCYAVLLGQMPHPHPLVVALSLVYIAYYVGVSVWLTLRARAARRSSRTGVTPAPYTPVTG
ncbi:MAG TPA: CDP-alcohol phosphatidyltransferase family protein [Kineosporiaceae bacterium]|jgi:phosphatidylcholine synthase|nr:CDP-alcohol phosphatidyltransferase family protein [Kineosporiaceae bacterium]